MRKIGGSVSKSTAAEDSMSMMALDFSEPLKKLSCPALIELEQIPF